VVTDGKLYLVCGAGETGVALASELRKQGGRIVLVDTDQEALDRSAESLEDVDGIRGDALDDEVLKQAGIQDAAGLFAALSEDRDNVFLCLSARRLYPGLRIVARIKEPETEPKLRLVGVSSIVNMSRVEGLRLAGVMLRPDVVSLTDQILFNPECDHSYCCIPVAQGSGTDGRRIRDLDVTGRTGVVLIALRRASGRMLYNPGAGERVHAGDSLIAFATPDEERTITDLLMGE
jgi:voltage-gated potassium channel